MRKEPILFAVVALLAGWYVKSNWSSGTRSSDPRSKALDYGAPTVPDPARTAVPKDRRDALSRDLFSQPRDTEPLPPLALAVPPLEPLGALAPPTPWGPVPALHAKFLRVAPRVVAAPGLFDAGEELDVAAVSLAFDPNDPEQRAARIASFKRQYDWVYTTGYKFGQLRNPDRYRVAARPSEKLVFYEVDPETGQARFKGTSSVVEFDRSQVQEFGFADTATNELELARVQFGAALSPTEFERALRLADRCIEVRNEAPRALEIAEELYRMAEAINLQADVRPRLGLARCMELGFRFEDAFNTYEALLAGGEATQPRVLARRGALRALLGLHPRAELDLKRAVELARTDHAVRQLYGRFLLARGRAPEALAQFAAAVDAEPRGDDEAATRMSLRLDLAGALLANGRTEEALDRFVRALTADPEDNSGLAQVAAAGLGAAALLSQGAGASGGDSAVMPTGGATPDAGFELLVTGGLAALRAGQFPSARAALELARRADPFRAALALGALSHLAEVTGHPEEALAFIQDAYTADPTDPWVLYQRGRLLAAGGDVTGAEQSFRAALDRELDYAPALEDLGALRMELGDHAAAELYFERALGLEPARAGTWSRRGFNHVALGDLEAAKLCFERARVERPGLASAGLGLAWWAYATGDTQEALTLFAQVEEDRRNAGPSDPVRVYAKSTGDRIRDHETKETWRDRFEREPGRIANGWRQEEGFGPETLLRDGAVVLEGTIDRKGRTRVFHELATDRYLSFFADVTVLPASRDTLNGVFIAVERERAGQSEAQAEILLGRNRDGTIQAKVRSSSADEGEWKDAAAAPAWPIGEPVRVGIERVGDEASSTFTLYVAGEPVFVGLKGDGIQRSRQSVRFGVFSEGDAGRKTALRLDDVEVVRRR